MMFKECLENNPPQLEANMKAKKTFWNLRHVAKWQSGNYFKTHFNEKEILCQVVSIEYDNAMTISDILTDIW